MMIWCEIIFKDSSTPKLFPDVRRLYSKAGFLCIELPTKDQSGRPIIVAYPHCNIFQVARPHPDHIGSEERDAEPS